MYRKRNAWTINTMEQNNNDNIIGYDFQGWPVRKKTLREVLIALGGKETDGNIVFDTNDTKLTFESYPRTLEDDGMGYGVNQRYITEVDVNDGNVTFWCEADRTYEPEEPEEE